ncbi:hypothetical protein Hanom_Chr06g00546081 [Helianthus anomalus]
MDAQPDLEVRQSHNQVGYISDPSDEYSEEFRSMIVGLNTCKIAHAQRENPIIDAHLI